MIILGIYRFWEENIYKQINYDQIMEKLKVLPLEEMCPYSDIDEGVDEWIDQDVGDGTYFKIVKGELIPVALIEQGRYTNHNLLSLDEAEKLYETNPLLTVLPVKEWYQTNYMV